MVMPKQPTTAGASVPSDDWDVINDATVARLEAGQNASSGADDGKTSFIFVPKDGEREKDDSDSSDDAVNVIGAGQPTKVRLALQKMAISPVLPGTPPVAPARPPLPPPPAAVFQPPGPESTLVPTVTIPAALPTPAAPASSSSSTTTTSSGKKTTSGREQKCLRDSGCIANDEQQMRHLVEREADVERARVANEQRIQRLRLGDPTANDEEIARRMQADEDARARELEARERENAEMREAEMIVEARRAAERQRAKSGPRQCECLGASAGVHRPACVFAK